MFSLTTKSVFKAEAPFSVPLFTFCNTSIFCSNNFLPLVVSLPAASIASSYNLLILVLASAFVSYISKLIPKFLPAFLSLSNCLSAFSSNKIFSASLFISSLVILWFSPLASLILFLAFWVTSLNFFLSAEKGFFNNDEPPSEAYKLPKVFVSVNKFW